MPVAPRTKDGESSRTVEIAKAAGFNGTGQNRIRDRFLKAGKFAWRGELPQEAALVLRKAQLPADWSPDSMQSLAGGLRYLVNGNVESFFPPGVPLVQVAPENATGRRLDYPFGINYQVSPRAYDSISFQFLRSIGDSVDLLRAAIERKKNIVAAQDYDFVPIDEELKSRINKDPTSIPPEMVEKIRKLKKFFKKPDNEHTWDQWLRSITEDILVIDAPTIFVDKTLVGGVHALVPIDGATISRKIDYWGRTPESPVTAYQQVIKGLPALDYTTNDMVYFPFNVRTGNIYGYPVVEQVPLTIDILLRRTLYQKDFYSAGANPNVPIEIPDEWTTSQAREFQNFWNEQMTVASRRWRAFALPGGAKLGKPMSYILKDEMDDWLARIICFVVGVSCSSLVSQMNRSSSEQQSDDTESESTKPLLKHIKATIDSLLVKFWNCDDIEFVWKKPVHPNILQQAQADHLGIEDGWLTINEARANRGLAPRPEEDIREHLERKQKQGGQDGRPLGAKGGDDTGEPHEAKRKHANTMDSIGDKMANSSFLKLSSAQKKRLVPISRLDPEFEQHTEDLKSRLRLAFDRKARSLAQLVLAATASAPDNSQKKSKKKDAALVLLALGVVGTFFRHWLERGWRDEYESIAEVLRAAARETARRFPEVSMGKPSIESAIDIANERAAMIVGMSYNASTHEPQPNDTPDWTIANDIRDESFAVTKDAVKSGATEDELYEALKKTTVFGDERAELIAVTEVGRVVRDAAHEAAVESGLMFKHQVTVGDNRVCGRCLENEAQGWIPVKESFVNGNINGQTHPMCRCSVQYSLDKPA